MIHFEDSHRTIVGYHGTRLSVALDIVNRRQPFDSPENEGDWLGRGVYFWEYAPRQAEWWADRSRRLRGWDEPVAILGSMIRLGACLDLLDPLNMDVIKRYHRDFCEKRAGIGAPIPANRRNKRSLNCAVFEYLYADLEPPGTPRRFGVDTARGAYVPTAAKKRIWAGSWLYEQSHIQVCVRNPACILGTWLHKPSTTGVADGKVSE